MEDHPNFLSGFWKELKRRKVIKVIALYATTAFILMEVVDLIVGPLHLPSWVETLVIVLLVIGFPIAIIFSWIFDVTPEGIAITVSSHEKDKKESPSASGKKRMLTNVIIGVLLIIVAALLIPRLFNKNNSNDVVLEKSIAVLPFINDSADEENTYIINGVMEEIINKLEKIEDLKVVSRTSVEKYRAKDKNSTRNRRRIKG
jgi:hypothetical protein